MAENIKENNARKIYSDIGFVVLSIFGGFITGLAFGVIGSFIYLIFLFPVIMGFIGGYIVAENAKYTKTRNVSIILLSSILTAAAIYGAFHYMRYVGLWALTAMQVFGDFSDKSLEAGRIIVEYSLEKETGISGFIGYMLFKAQQGVSVGKIYSSSKLNLGPIITWIYWLMEIGVIGFITFHVGKQVLKKPFCEFCNSWYTEKKHIGGVPATEEIEMLNLIKRKDFANVGANLEENADSPSVELYLQSCSSCDMSNAFLKITGVKFINGKPVFNELSETTLSPREKDILTKAMKFLN